MDWVSKQPKKRAEILSGVLSLDFSKDDFITSQVICKYGDDEKVAASFFSNYITGSWTGQASAHWDELADKLDEVHERTTLPKLSKWTVNSARYLRQMAERERQGEEEENVRRR
jgi:hypothetical protein